MSTLTNEKNIRNFETVALMKLCDALEAGMICETLGYYRKGDGGGARYIIETAGTESANEMDIIEITGEPDGSDQLIARFMHEGKPVNVLQFGAINFYSTDDKFKGIDPFDHIGTRDDTKAIQRAIDYTFNNLCLLETFVDGDLIHSTNNINTIIIPEGNYITREQINLPPYMQIQLDGDVQFYSVMKENNITLYRYDPDAVDENGNKLFFVPIENFNDVLHEKEVFAKNEYKLETTDLKVYNSDKDEYYVFKKGIIKICHRYTEDGKLKIPHSGRYAVSPQANTEVFCGRGSLTILNKSVIKTTDESGKEIYVPPCYICGVEVGSTEDYIRLKSNASPITEQVPYNNLRFSNLKMTECYVGFLSHAHTFYSNVINNAEFFNNTIAFQHGIYGEEVNKDDPAGCYGTSLLIGEKVVDSAEMNHFRDCLFTGNKISVNILLSSAILNFNSCHFDFENCVFRAAYRTSLTMANCHIEGIGKELGKKYFSEGIPTSSLMTNFKNRAQNDPMDEFVGILYAKPITKVNGVEGRQNSFVNLSIVNSMIVENMYMPWSVFSYYNDQLESSDTTDGHHRSNLHLENITYATTSGRPISFLTTNDNGAVHSGFLLSEYPEVAENNAFQNVPVVSRDSKEWASWKLESSNRVNHRFLSNRTLANKYPYFQNVSLCGSTIEGITITNPNNAASITFNRQYNSPFINYDSNAGHLRIGDIIKVVNDSTTEAMTPHIITISLDNDEIDCVKGDTLSAALVTDMVTFNSRIDTSNGDFNEEQSLYSHHIRFVELDSQENNIGSYDYEVPYCVEKNEDMYNYNGTIPSTSVCRHMIHNQNTTKVKIEIDYYCGIIITDYEMDPSYSSLYAVLVEKNK